MKKPPMPWDQAAVPVPGAQIKSRTVDHQRIGAAYSDSFLCAAKDCFHKVFPFYLFIDPRQT